MTRVCVIATCLVLGATGTSFANPIWSSDTADGCYFGYICGSSEAPQEEHRSAPHQPLDITARQAPDETARKSPAKRIKPTSVTATLHKNQAGPPVAAAVKQEPAPPTVAIAAASPNVQPEAPVVERTPQQQVMAALQIAAQITAVDTPGPNAKSHANSDQASDAGASQARDTTKLVALLISKADTTSVSALTGASIAIDAAQSGAENDIRTALAAAGATEVQLTPGDTKPVDRVIRGEVPAAVVGLVSYDAAEAFPEVKGFKVLRVPLAHQDKS